MQKRPSRQRLSSNAVPAGNQTSATAGGIPDTGRHFSTDWRSVSELAISRQLRAKSAKRPCGAPCVGIRRTWSGKSETVQSEDRDVVDLAESSRLFGDALRCLGADFTSTFETEKLASCALGFNHAVGEQREAVTGV
jgi:hypothetical protein